MPKIVDLPEMFSPIIKAISHAAIAMGMMGERLHAMKIGKALREHVVHKAAAPWRERGVDPSTQVAAALPMNQHGRLHQPPVEIGENPKA